MGNTYAPNRILKDPRTITVPTTGIQIAGPNARRVRIAISAPLTNPINIALDVTPTATTGWALTVGGFPVVFGDGKTVGIFDQSIQAIAIGGPATVYVIDEFLAPDYFP